MTDINIDPTLDELYSIRRVLVSMHQAHLRKMERDPFSLAYYANKVNALDQAISCYVQAANIPLDIVERHSKSPGMMLEDAARAAVYGEEAAPVPASNRPEIRIPGLDR